VAILNCHGFFALGYGTPPKNDMHPKKVTVKKVTGVKLVTLFILILAVTQHIH